MSATSRAGKATRGARKRAAAPEAVPPHLLAATYLALLAYPADSDIPKRNKFVLAARAHFLKLYLERGWLNRAANRWPERSSWPNKKIQDTINAGWRLIRNRRVAAAELLILEYFRLTRDPVGVLFKWMKNAEIIHRLDEEVDSAKKNIMFRVRKESMPVLHIAVAFRQLLPKPGGGKKVGAYYLLNNPSWTADMERVARAWKKAIVHLPRYEGSCSAQFPRFLD